MQTPHQVYCPPHNSKHYSAWRTGPGQHVQVVPRSDQEPISGPMHEAGPKPLLELGHEKSVLPLCLLLELVMAHLSHMSIVVCPMAEDHVQVLLDQNQHIRSLGLPVKP